MGPAVRAEAIAWSDYAYALKSGQTIPAQMGTLDVPLHHAAPDGKTLTLHFVRLPAAHAGTGSPIIYLAGGPGSSGIDAGRGARWPLFDALRQEGDVILLDQRGVGLSSPPPPCKTPWSFPATQASTEASFNASLEAAARICAKEWRDAGVDLTAYNTADNAADVADLARALGGHVRLVGISYGTFLAFAVLRDHSDLIELAVLAGTEGPDDTVKLPTQADDVLARLSRVVAQTPAAAKLTPDLKRSVETVLGRLGKAPVWADVKSGDGKTSRLSISQYDMQMVTAFLMATSDNATQLPALYASMERGDFSRAARLVLWLRAFFASLPAMPLATDAASPVSPERMARVHALAAHSLFGNAVNAPSADFAEALGVRKLDRRWRMPLHTATPGYFISGTLDSRTPPQNAEDVRKGFHTNAHLILHGAGHDNDLFLSSPVIVQRIRSFLRGEPAHDETISVAPMHFD
jgi:pimeloyl-ACP methyl ester carboxylesterase